MKAYCTIICEVKCGDFSLFLLSPVAGLDTNLYCSQFGQRLAAAGKPHIKAVDTPACFAEALATLAMTVYNMFPRKCTSGNESPHALFAAICNTAEL